MKKVLSNRAAIAVFIVPGLLLYLWIVIYPIVWSVGYSFFEGMPGVSMKWVGIENYLKMFADQQFFSSFIINLKYVLVVGLGQVLFGMFLALLFNFGIKKYTTLVRTISFLPVILPVVAVGQLFTKIYDIVPQYGLLNSLLSAVGLESLVKPWIGLPSTALTALCIQDIWKGMGFYAIILYAAVISISKEMLEAADIDGANGPNLFRYMIFPQLKPMLNTCLVLSMSGTLKVFASAMALTRGGPGNSTRMLTMYMYETAFGYGQYGYGSAIAVFILAECILIALVIKRFSKNVEVY